MIEKTRVILFYFFLTILVLSEVWGLVLDRKLLLYFIIIFPPLLLTTHIFDKKRIKFPLLITIIFIVFNICTAVSTIVAINKQIAFEHQLFYVASFLLFIFIFNNRTVIKNFFVTYFLTISFITIIYSLFLQFIAKDWLPDLIPDHTYQLVYKYPGYLNHYPIGAFALIIWGLLLSRLLIRKSAIIIMSLALVSVLIMWSSLRSAYVSIILILFLLSFYWKQNYKNKITNIILILICIFLGSFFITTKTNIYIPGLTEIHKFLDLSGAPFEHKTLVNTRESYYEQAWSAFKNRPILGFGSYNFNFVSLRYSENLDYLTSTSHNIFLDILVENGIIGFLSFICLVILIVYSARHTLHKKDFDNIPYVICFFLLLFLFQLNFYSRFYFFFILMFIFTALFYKEKILIKEKIIFLCASSILIIICIGLYASQVVYSYGNYGQALTIYPLNNEAYRKRIELLSKQNEDNEANYIIRKYISLNSENPSALSFIGSLYLERQEFKIASQYLEKAMVLAPHEPDIIINAYYAKKHSVSQLKASEMLLKHIKKYDVFSAYSTEMKSLKDLCGRENIQCGI